MMRPGLHASALHKRHLIPTSHAALPSPPVERLFRLTTANVTSVTFLLQREFATASVKIFLRRTNVYSSVRPPSQQTEETTCRQQTMKSSRAIS
jgi:hypothetical protein